jgi:hypothetical protein
LQPYSELSLSAQTAYAQLLDAARAAELTRTVSSLNGSFAKKVVKGRTYWYFQHTDLSGKLRQLYIGPDSDEIRELIGQSKTPSPRQALQPLARSALALGCGGVLARHFRVVRRLSEYGFFHAGGVLIGTHAFLSYGNMLGVRWGEAARTQDVDFAHAGKNMAVALLSNIEIDTHGAIESLKMGFLPAMGATGKSGATYLISRDPDFQLDFVTTLHRGGETPYEHPKLGIALQPLKFMEYLIEDVAQAALFCDEGAVVVNVPNPARYALHKLLVYGERTGTFLQKANKDILQAAALLTYYRAHRAWEVEKAWEDLVTRGKGWTTRAKESLKVLGRVAPYLEAGDWLKTPGTSGTKSKAGRAGAKPVVKKTRNPK